MIAENIERNIMGKLSLPDDIADKSIISVVSFIQTHLPKLRNFRNIKQEDDLSQEFVIILNKNKPPLYHFFSQYIDRNNKKKSTIDIGTLTLEKNIYIDTESYSDNKSFFSIEAKRLDSNLPSCRKNEYVVGRIENNKYKDTGGIERFKKRIHGNGLKYAGLLGYVQSENFENWINKINIIIDEQIITPNSSNIRWDSNDKIIEIFQDKNLRKFVSENLRNDNSIIKIFHLWIDLTF